MSTSLVLPRPSRVAAAGLTATLACAGLVAAAPTASAVSGTISYTCTAEGLGTFTLPVVLDTNAPARVVAGQTIPVTLTATAKLPGEVAKSASTTATSFDGSWTAKASFGAAAADVTQTIARTPLGDQTVATEVPFSASSTAFPFVVPSTLGTIEVIAGNLAGTIQLYDSTGAAARPATPITCDLPGGKPPVIDTIAVVATSITTLALDKAAIAYGQDVTATAKVTTSGGAPDGEVVFSVDGRTSTRVRVDKDGVATLALPDAVVGGHTVVATFAPRDPAAYGGSTASQRLTVAQVSTRMRLPVTGRTTTTATKVGVRAKGAYDTVPTGKVRIRVQRVGRTGKTIKVRTLSDTGTATAGFGRLQTGRYQVVVVYRGDANHRYLKKSRSFRVTRG